MNGMSINPETALLQISHLQRAAEQARGTGMERLSSGAKVNRGADDPSGLAIGSGMNAQLRGLDTAIHNLTEGIDLIHAADSVLSEVQDIFFRIRDLCVRGANQAVVNTVSDAPLSDPFCDSRIIDREITVLQTEVHRVATGVTHNGKQVYHDFTPPGGQVLQIGPDNGSNHTIAIEIPNLEFLGIPVVPFRAGTLTSQDFTTSFQSTLDLVDGKLDTISDTRADLGAKEKRMLGYLGDLNAQRINIAAAKSNIIDADFAVEFVDMTRANINSNFSMMAYAQATIDPNLVYTLMNSAGL